MTRYKRARALATVLFTDIVDSTSLAGGLGDARWKALLARHHAIVRRELRRFRGSEIDTAGDGFFATFDGQADAIACACAIEDAVRELGIEVRAGVHVGEAELTGHLVRGIVVNTGARIMAAAGPGEVLVSSMLKDLVPGGGFGFVDHGIHHLKGVDGDWRLWSVTSIDGQPRPPVLAAEEALSRLDAVRPLPLVRRRRGVLALAAGVGLVLAVAAIFFASKDDAASRPVPSEAPGPALGSAVQVDPVTGRILREVPDVLQETGGGNPRIAAGEGSIWVRTNTIAVIDPASGEVRDFVSVGGLQPGNSPSLAVGFRTVWIPGGDFARPQLDRVNPATLEQLRTIELGPPAIPTDVAVGAGAVWVSFTNGVLERIDPATGRATDDLDVGGTLDAVAADENGVWVLDTVRSTLTRIDPDDGSLTTVTVSSNTRLLAAGEGGVWVVDPFASTAMLIDLANDPHPPVGIGTEPTDVAVGLGAVWISGEDGALYRVDPLTLVVTSFPVAEGPLTSITVDEGSGTLWLTVGGARG